MAALGTIRSKGKFLVGIIGLALFAFVAEEGFRSCESTNREKSQIAGKICGEKINAQDFSNMVEEFTEVMKLRSGRDNFSDVELNGLRDQVWQQLVTNTIIAKECEALGLSVTDEELQDVLKQGTNPLLMQTPFVNQQTGRFDVNALQKFITEYKQAQTQNPQMAEQYAPMYKMWTYIEKNLRESILMQKYQALLAGCLGSNDVEAKMAFDAENVESNIQIAYLDYKSVNDKDVEIKTSDLEAKLKELKEAFRNPVETRDVKYVSFQVTASAADKAGLKKKMDEFQGQLASATNIADVVRKSQSDVPYLGLPVRKQVLPMDIQNRLDSIAVGSTTAVYENAGDNTLNIVRLISKVQLPDSIEFRLIGSTAQTPDLAKTQADSMLNALNGGADFEVLAKNHQQTGQKQWLTSEMYEGAPSIDADNKDVFSALNSMSVGEKRVVTTSQTSLVIEVTDRKGNTDKYDVAVIKKPIKFEKDTYTAAYNKFSQFVSESNSLEAIEKNAAKYGYSVQTQNNVTTAQHGIANINATREALKWVFKADKGEVSPLYECGQSDNLLVCVLTGVNKKGYLTLDNEQVKEAIKAEVLKDKKAEKLLAKLGTPKSIKEAQAKGAKVADVNQVTFSSPVFVQATQSMELALSGAVAATAQGQFSKTPVKGEGGVYTFLVKSKKNLGNKFDAKTYKQRLEQMLLQAAFRSVMSDLMLKANVEDNRYLFM